MRSQGQVKCPNTIQIAPGNTMTYSREIAFIDPAVADFQTLLAALRPDVESVVLSRDEPAISQMARILQGRTNLDAIHVIAHGRPGEVSFAAGAFTYETIRHETAELSGFGVALGKERALQIWACEAGAGERGTAFVDLLAARTGVCVAAASGIVGAEFRGGTWSLDRGAGPGRPPLTPEGMMTYAGIMATFTGTSGNDRANATTGTLTGFSGGTVAQLQDASGDTFNPGSGADEIVAGSGDDTINLGSGQFVAGESIEGGGNSASGTRDQIVLTAGGTFNFSLGTVSGIETLTGSTGSDTVTMTASQWAGFITMDLGSGLLTTDVLNVLASGSISALATPTISNVETGNLTGTSGTDTVTLSGAQLDAILIGTGTINLGSGTGDTINLTSTSSDLNSLGATNASIQGVEEISASGAAAGVTVTLSGQTEAFTVTGSAQADNITAGSGGDTIVGGAGADTINGGAGNDTITYDGTDVSIAGGTNTDTLVVTGAATINLSSADQSSGDTANITGFENVNASGSSVALSLTGSSAANVLNGGSGADTIVGGAGTDTIAGGAGNDTITYDGSDTSIAGGADIDTLLVNGAATINLSSADQSSGDTANTTGFENVNATGSSSAVSLTGNSGANALTGGSANDTLNGGGGNDTIDGGGGTGDTVVFSGAFANYTISLAGATYTIADNRSGAPDGADTVTGVENFQFSDGTRTASQLNPKNKIVLENQKQCNPVSEWGITGDGDVNIQGFATEISTNIGGTVSFKIATDSTDYRIEIYRLGYYGGAGARKVGTVDVNLASAQVQPHPIVDMSRGLIDCGNWSVSATWAIPSDMVSGVYIAKLVREDGTAGASHIPFIVRDDSSTSDIVFQTSDTTWQAYNAWGGASLYYGEVPVDPADMIGYRPPNCGCGLTAIGRASAVSYNRPFITNTSPIGGTHDFIFGVAGSSRTAMTSPTSPASTQREAAACCSITRLFFRSAMMSTGRLNSAPTSRRRATQASTLPSGAATKSTGRFAGKPASTATARPTARWSATRKPGVGPQIRAPRAPVPGETRGLPIQGRSRRTR